MRWKDVVVRKSLLEEGAAHTVYPVQTFNLQCHVLTVDLPIGMKSSGVVIMHFPPSALGTI